MSSELSPFHAISCYDSPSTEGVISNDTTANFQELMRQQKELELKKMVRTLYLKKQIPEALQLIAKEENLSKSIVEIHKSLKEINQTELVVENEEGVVNSSDIEDKINEQLLNNRIAHFKGLLFRQLDLEGTILTESRKEEISKCWDEMMSLSVAKFAIGKQWCYSYLGLSIWERPKVHEEIVATIQSSGKAKSVSTVHTIVPYLCMLLKQCKSYGGTVKVVKLLETSYNQYFKHYISGRLSLLTQPYLDDLLGIPERQNEEFETALNDFVQEQISIIKKMEKGESHFIIGNWFLPEGCHAVGYLIERKESDFTLTIIDSDEDLGVTLDARLEVNQKEGSRRRINPFLTFKGLSLEQILNSFLYEEIFTSTVGFEIESKKEFLINVLGYLDISWEDRKHYIQEDQRLNYAAQQGDTCRWKMINMLLKGVVDREQGGNGEHSKALMKQLKAYSIQTLNHD